MNQNKYLEYYLDSRIYTDEEVKESIKQTKKEFKKKNPKVSVTLNQFGVYVITFEFEGRQSLFDRIIIKLWAKVRKTLMLDSGATTRLNEYTGNKRYGQYKPTKTYKPY